MLEFGEEVSALLFLVLWNSVLIFLKDFGEEVLFVVLGLAFNSQLFNLLHFLLKDLLLESILSNLPFALQLSVVYKRSFGADCHSSGVASAVLDLVDTVFEDFVLMLGQQPDEWLSTVPVDGA